MNLAQFATRWQSSTLTERAAAQSHFNDLCALLNQKTPTEADPNGEWYTFEKSVTKIGGDAKGFADVWKKGYFAWEYKGKKKDLAAAYKQLSAYHDDLGNPPVLVVCDLNRFEVHLKVTNLPKRIFTFDLQDLAANVPTDSCALPPLEVLRATMENPKDLYPTRTAEQITEEIAAEFGKMARNLIGRGNEPHTVARFLIRLLFCLFAEDVGLLESGMFTRTVEQFRDKPEYFKQSLSSLFRVMATGGPFGATLVKHFNGGLFTDDSVLDLTTADLSTLLVLANKDWKSIEPSIFGTLFERSLDPTKRSQLGAHYTSRTDIEAVVEPVLLPPLRREWDTVRQQAEGIVSRKQRAAAEIKPASTPAELTRARREIADADTQLTALLSSFTDKIASVRVLDPACGSGNFLYVSLRYLLDLEHAVIEYAYRNGLTGFFPKVSPEQMRGIELNEYAHELAPVTIWIGYLQWMRENGYSSSIEEPILRRTDMVEHRDALMVVADDGTVSEARWPAADYIVGNPPFLGGKRLRAELGDNYVDRLFATFAGRVPHEADLVTYWFEKARGLIESC